MKSIIVFFLEQQLANLDKRKKEALFLKAKIKEITDFQQIKNTNPCLKKITSRDFKTIINDAGVYYFVCYQENDSCFVA
ncbi:MAG: hypothetical protein ACFFD4_40405 [Candidatus Odinarchaeota archaeon]